MLDEYFIRRCLKLAQVAFENGDQPVGALIARRGEVIAEGFESIILLKDPTAHAEILVVRRACEKLEKLSLSGCVLYSNVEPCWMCSYAIRQAALSRVCFRTRNLEIGGVSSKFPVLFDDNLKLPKPEVKAGILFE